MKRTLNKTDKFKELFQQIKETGNVILSDISKDSMDNTNGMNLLHYACSMYRAADFSVIEYLINTVGININAQDTKGYTALHLLCIDPLENLEIIKYFIMSAKADASIKNIYDMTSLHMLFKHSEYYGKNLILDLDLIKTAIGQNKIDVNIKDKEGDTFLGSLCHADEPRLEIIKYLIEECNADVNVLSYGDQTLLHNNKSIELVKYLVEKTKISVNAHGYNGYSALCENIISGNEEIALYLIQNKKTDVNNKSKYSFTALNYAIDQNDPNLEIIKLLLEKGSNPNILNRDENTPFQQCSETIDYYKTKQDVDKIKKFESILDYMYAAIFSDKLISEKLVDVKSQFLCNNLDTDINELIVNRIFNSLYNLSGANQSNNFFKNYKDAVETLNYNLKFIDSNSIKLFEKLSGLNETIPYLQFEILNNLPKDKEIYDNSKLILQNSPYKFCYDLLNQDDNVIIEDSIIGDNN